MCCAKLCGLRLRFYCLYGGLHEIVNINMFIKRSSGMAVVVCVCDDACKLRFESATRHIVFFMV